MLKWWSDLLFQPFLKPNLSLTLNLQNDLPVDPDIKSVFEKEKELIGQRKEKVYEGIEDKKKGEFVGLALSGGGIRSATFCTGVLQVFDDHDLMKHVDYLSTVSGGGFAGSAYTAWKLRKTIKKNPKGQSESHPNLKVKKDPPDTFKNLLPHLRKFSNYLAPRLGFTSDEFWRIIGTYFRNIILHWTVLLSAVILAFTLILAGLRQPKNTGIMALALGFLLILFGWYQEVKAKACLKAEAQNEQFEINEKLNVINLLQGTHLSLFFGIAFWGLGSAIFFVVSTFNEPDSITWPLPFYGEIQVPATLGYPFLILVMSAILIILSGFTSEWRWKKRRNLELIPPLSGLLFVFAFPLILWFLLFHYNGLNQTLSLSNHSLNSAWTWIWQTAVSMISMGIIVSLVIATYTRKMDREEREWATRIVSTLLAAAFGWFSLSGLALFSIFLADNITWNKGGIAIASTGGLWGVLSFLTAYLGKNVEFKDLIKTSWKNVLFFLGPPLFLIGLVVFTNFATAKVLILQYGSKAVWDDGSLWGLFVGVATVLLAAGLTLDPNEFSLHGFYRDRLVRCYLGASNADSPAPDSVWNIKTDDLPLSSLKESIEKDGTPLHLINTAVNLFGSKSLRVRQRGCDSFVLTPLHCGSRVTHYSPIPETLYLGTAVAISGAAFSSAMGLATRGAAIAAIMTFFNLRLGYWFGNPRSTFFGKRKRPPFAPVYLFSEALSLTNEEKHYINLSDGGHFDNLGLYELIRRRCKLIIVVDAECDEKYAFAALGEAIRLVRIDFNINVSLDFQKMAPIPGNNRYAQAHFAVGQIDYSTVNIPEDWLKKGASPYGEPEKGYILYIKNSLASPGQNSDIPGDVLEYACLHPSFPHEPTSDQFFNEAQFESYRKLGESIAEHTLKRLNYQTGSPLDELIKTLKNIYDKQQIAC